MTSPPTNEPNESSTMSESTEDFPLIRPTRTLDAIIFTQLDKSVIQEADVWGDDLMVALDRAIQEFRNPENNDPKEVFSQTFIGLWYEVIIKYEELFGHDWRTQAQIVAEREANQVEEQLEEKVTEA